jgi:hypothetical protein
MVENHGCNDGIKLGIWVREVVEMGRQSLDGLVSC